VKGLWFEMSIAVEHLPILVSCNKGNVFDCKTRLKETAGPLMSKIVKVKVLDLQDAALSAKCSPD
jgi:hypothetical protein